MQMHINNVIARCPTCRSELPLSVDQAAWLAGGKRSWLFCPLCRRIVAAEPTIANDVRETPRKGRKSGHRSTGTWS
jgi:hypothetical protein